MALYDYFVIHPFGVGPRSLVVIYTGLTGGGTLNLDGEVTIGSETDGTVCRFYINSNTVASLWQLIASNHVDDPANGWKRPLDYADGQNQKVWKQLLSFGTGGGGGGSIQITSEVPAGAINGVNTIYTTANAFVNTSLAPYVNGLRQRPTADFTVTGSTTFQMNSPLLAGDTLIVDYTVV